MYFAFSLMIATSIFCFIFAFFTAKNAKSNMFGWKNGMIWKPESQYTHIKNDVLEEKIFEGLFYSCIGVFVGILLGLPAIIVVLTGFSMVLFPHLVAIRKKRRREGEIERQLEGALLDMTAVLWTNPSIRAAIVAARDGLQEPLREELECVIREIDCGRSIDEALCSLATRNNLVTIKIIVGAITVCRETGGNLARVLERVASLIRMRILLKEEIDALTSQQKTAAYAISIMPFIFLCITQILNPGYLSYLSTPLGMVALVYAAASIGCGFLVLRRMSDLLPRG